MAHIQVEASVRTHRKFLQVGPAASWLWLCGMGYCQDGLTDGFIPFEAIDYLGIKGTTARKLKCALVTVGLWEEVTGGWQVHHYLRHNKSAEVIRSFKKGKQDAGKVGGLASGEARREASASTPASTTSEAPVEPISTLLSPAHLKSAPTQRQEQPRPLSPIHTTHKAHAACGRVCVPAFLHTEFVGRRNHLQADKELRDFYGEIDAVWSIGVKAGDEPGESIAFWRARYAERWPSTSSAGQQSSSRQPQWVQDVNAKRAAHDAAQRRNS